MQLSSADVAQIVQEVWTSMLGAEIDPVDVPPATEGPALAGSVGVSGASDALIAVEMSQDAGRFVASAMFGMGADEVSGDDVADAVGELTNMVGGNVKSLLPEPSTLSLPVVAHGTIPTLRVVGGQAIIHQAFLSADKPVFVSVFSRQPTS